MSWTKEDEVKLVDMYTENKSTIEMAKVFGKKITDINDKLLEFNLDPYIRPVDVNLKCPNCDTNSKDIKLLDIGLTTHKWYYKCTKCDYVFAGP
jgi:rubredoxin